MVNRLILQVTKAVGLLGALFLTGCAGGPQNIATQFFDATNRDDAPATEKLLTEKARANVGSGKAKSPKLTVNNTPANHITVLSTTVDGEQATVSCRVEGEGKPQNVNLKMRKENGDWRIYALAIPTEPGKPDFLIDLEHPETMISEIFKQVAKPASDAAKALGEGLKSLGQGLQKAGESMSPSNPVSK